MYAYKYKYMNSYRTRHKDNDSTAKASWAKFPKDSLQTRSAIFELVVKPLSLIRMIGANGSNQNPRLLNGMTTADRSGCPCAWQFAHLLLLVS